MDTREFQRILNETVVPNNLPLEEQAAKSNMLYGYAKQHMPSALFRYRRCNERSLDAFYHDKVWVSTGACMNDGFDSRLYVDKKEVFAWRDQLQNNELYELLRKFFGDGMPLPDNIAALPGLEQRYKEILTMSSQQKEEYLNNLISFVFNDITAVMGAIASITQKSIKFCCLSEHIGSAYMWGQYADNETGFALAYDCRDLGSSVPPENGFPRSCSCLPMIYGDHRFQVPTDAVIAMLRYRLLNVVMTNSGYVQFAPAAAQLILQAQPFPDTLLPTKISLFKSTDWRQEAEWRLFCFSNDNAFLTPAHASFTLKPTALYLGREISSIYEKILSDIAREKGIRVYKMRLDDESPTYELIAEPIS